MQHHEAIALRANNLQRRSTLVHAIRTWFVERGFTEIEAPQIVRSPDQAPYLDPVQVSLHNERSEGNPGYLITSPEYTMKKCLAAGMQNIFCLGKVFRDHESFGGNHNPEFTLLEWYRAHADMTALMDDVESLFDTLYQLADTAPLSVERVHMRDLWMTHSQVHLDEYLTDSAMFDLCKQRGYNPSLDEPYEDLFYRIFLNEIEPKLPENCITIIHHYPLLMAALSKPSEIDNGYAERFEVYRGSLELANAFSELTDSVELQTRLQADISTREALGKHIPPLDKQLIAATAHMPPSAGIALGIDRLIMLLLETDEINDVLPLGAADLFTNT